MKSYNVWPLYVASFIFCNGFKVFLCYIMYQYFTPFHCQIIFHLSDRIYLILFFHPSVDHIWANSRLWLLWIMLLWIFVYKLLWGGHVFIYLGYTSRNGIFGSWILFEMTTSGNFSHLLCQTADCHSSFQQMCLPIVTSLPYLDSGVHMETSNH